MTRLIGFFFSALTALLVLPTGGQAAVEEPSGYETGFDTMAKIVADLQRALEPKDKAEVYPVPVFVDKMAVPYLQLQETAGGNATHAIYISSGFIGLLNFISHAKAIDGARPGFFAKSLTRLSAEESEPWPPDLQASAAANSWSFDTMNRQASAFNQIAGGLAAIQMAHFTLGHYQKYARNLAGAQMPALSINGVVTPAEWRRAVLQGAGHALECGLAVDGLKIFFESIGKMPTRPAWRIYFVPDDLDARGMNKINRDLDELQRKAFLSFRR